MLLPTILGLVFDLTVPNEALIQDLFMHALRAFIIIAVMINVLLTVAQRKGDVISASNWFMFMALASFIFGSQFRFFGELADSTQTVWLGENVTILDTYRTYLLSCISRSSSCDKSPDLVRFNDEGKPSSSLLHLASIHAIIG